jgi:hypothetical protein
MFDHPARQMGINTDQSLRQNAALHQSNCALKGWLKKIATLNVKQDVYKLKIV